jgi:SNF2 family DNA or RNA helicase
VQRCELDADERAVYESLRLAARQQVAAQVDGRGAALDTLEALLRLRQACCDRALVPGGGAGAPPASSKLQLLIELLETALAEGHKVLVFTQWTSLLDRIEPLLRAAGWQFLRLDGSTRNRSEVVAAFQSERGPPVLLLSLKAGGVGLNLTAADQVVLLDPWWNPAAEDQAADRAHRIGQLRPVLITRLIASETIEEQVLELQAHKRRMTAAALGSEGRLDTLDREQLLALLA